MDRLYGVFLIALSAVSFGAMAIFARFAYEAGSDPITVLFLRFTIAGIFMLAIMVANASMISTLEPVVTVALAIMVLGETMTLHKILGGMMIFAAVLLLTRREAGSKIS